MLQLNNNSIQTTKNYYLNLEECEIFFLKRIEKKKLFEILFICTEHRIRENFTLKNKIKIRKQYHSYQYQII